MLKMSDHRLFLIGGADDESGVLTETRGIDFCRLAFAYRGGQIEVESGDFFEALCQIRLCLEPAGLIPFCYGASLNVYPSGMARDMGLGLGAYKLTIGKHSNRHDLVQIFSVGPDIIPVSVKLQLEFYEKWLQTPKA
jgi:hypothetical protein